MNLVVLPISRVPGGPLAINPVIIGVSILIVAAGIPLSVSFDSHFSKR
jgi:hypothetical protein